MADSTQKQLKQLKETAGKTKQQFYPYTVPEAVLNDDGTTLKDTLDNLPSIYMQQSEKGNADGVATLGEDGKIPEEQMPQGYSDMKSNMLTEQEASEQYLAKSVAESDYLKKDDAEETYAKKDDMTIILVDESLSKTSENPVQNKVVKEALDSKADLASPSFTGTPEAPTASSDTNSTQIATTSFVKTAVSNHNSSSEAHSDIRLLISGLTARLNALADSDDTTLDQLSEIVAYIKSNKSLIEGITTNKVNVSDIIDDLTSSATDKPISAKQAKILKGMITDLTDLVGDKVDKVSGKGLSENDYTTSEKNKLSGIAAGAEVNVQADWNETDTESDAFIKHKPVIPTVGNGTVTISQAGVQKGTFTMNQSGDTAIELDGATAETNTGTPFSQEPQTIYITNSGKGTQDGKTSANAASTTSWRNTVKSSNIIFYLSAATDISFDGMSNLNVSFAGAYDYEARIHVNSGISNISFLSNGRITFVTDSEDAYPMMHSINVYAEYIRFGNDGSQTKLQMHGSNFYASASIQTKYAHTLYFCQCSLFSFLQKLSDLNNTYADERFSFMHCNIAFRVISAAADSEIGNFDFSQVLLYFSTAPTSGKTIKFISNLPLKAVKKGSLVFNNLSSSSVDAPEDIA